MMAGIGSQENKRVRRAGDSRESAEMAYGMTGGIQKIKRPIAEEVDGVKASDFQTRAFFLHVNFPAVPASGVGFQDAGFGIDWISRAIMFLEARANDQIRRRWKRGRVPDMVEMGVRPNDGLNVLAPHTQPRTFSIQDLRYISCALDLRRLLDQRYNSGRIVLPIGPYTEVKDDVTVSSVGDQKTIHGSFTAILETFDPRRPKKPLAINIQGLDTGASWSTVVARTRCGKP